MPCVILPDRKNVCPMSKYKTISGDQWDVIAKRELGSESYTHLLMDANTKYISYVIFPAGIELTLPTIDDSVSTDNLPPWKR